MDIKSRKIEELIRVKLTELMLKGLKDPRLHSFITILDVSLSKDGKHATVTVSVIGTDREKETALRGLESARGYIQMRIGRELRVKYTPHLLFRLDDTTEDRVRLVHRLSELERQERPTAGETPGPALEGGGPDDAAVGEND